jgi:O-succinylbenzoic acid--CoA ligase
LKINISSDENHLLLNPRLPSASAQVAQEAWKKWSPQVQGHIGLLTSGSTNALGKIVLLSKAALLESAAAVNQHLTISVADIWMQTLPSFHVGGLGIEVRASLNGAQVFNDFAEIGSWNPQLFLKRTQETRATLVSLVPSQVFDLTAAQLRAPPSVRAVIVGGGALNKELSESAQKLGWPVLPSYGLSECCSQVATALTPTGAPQLLPHVQVQQTEQRKLQIKSKALLTAYILLSQPGGEWLDPKQDGWFTTEDEVEIVGQTLEMKGRSQDFLKIAGESVSLSQLEARLEAVRIEQGFLWDVALVALPDKRLGASLHLLVEQTAPAEEVQTLQQQFDSRVLPFERIRQVHILEQIPRSALGKLLRSRAAELIGSRNSSP